MIKLPFQELDNKVDCISAQLIELCLFVKENDTKKQERPESYVDAEAIKNIVGDRETNPEPEPVNIHPDPHQPNFII